ncbi:MAG TPA: sigma-70 family RNA polymerase sigma factor [Candidatus Acidoferrales bacterium]|nr:sigma-70 family RNA polymerase sigma factor [Candidatus Acidoferrales bacterium]
MTRNQNEMPNVPKNMAATASAMPLPLGAREKGQEERALVQRAQKGDERAFEQLVRQHQHRVFGLVARVLHRQDDVEDIAQQVFLKVYLSLNRFDQRAAFSTWLYKIAVNECWDHLRKKKVRPLLYESDLSEEQVSQLDGIAALGRPSEGLDAQAETRDTLERVLDVLPEQDRQLLLLKEVEGFSVQELAEILGLNVNTVKVRLFRARGRIVEAQRRRSGAGALRKGPSATERKP